jgi:prolyl 4-hydroxylase
MLNNCAKSCGACDGSSSEVADVDDYDTASLLEKTVKFGVAQTAAGNKAHLTMVVIRKMMDYLERSDDFMALPTKIQENCKNNHELCSFWAAIGECEANVAFMKVQCAPGKIISMII